MEELITVMDISEQVLLAVCGKVEGIDIILPS
jgi:hypothetical protein